MDLRSRKSTSLGAEKSPQDAADTMSELPTTTAIATISPHATSDQFKVWKVRFTSYIRDKKPLLCPALKAGASDDTLGDVAAQFAAVLVGWLDSEFILDLSRVVNVEAHGVAMFARVCSRFATSSSC